MNSFTLKLDLAAKRGSTTSCEPKTWKKFGEVTIVQAARSFLVPTTQTGVLVVLFVDFVVDARNGSDPCVFRLRLPRCRRTVDLQPLMRMSASKFGYDSC